MDVMQDALEHASRKELVEWICSQYENRDCEPMLRGYRRRLETFADCELVAIAKYILRVREVRNARK